MAEAVHIVEVFSSIQGEGVHMGRRQVFVRFFPCNLSCSYCDTPTEASAVRDCLVERDPGSGTFARISNPLDADALTDVVVPLMESGRHHSISLTGGEPLLQAPFLAAWISKLGGRFPLYLETNGTLCDELESVIGGIDFIAMDIKLPKTAGIKPQWESHRRFLGSASSKEVFIKVIVSAATGEAEFDQAVRIVADRDPAIPFVIQPVTKLKGPDVPPGAKGLLAFYERAARRLRDVRVIPQAHRMMGML